MCGIFGIIHQKPVYFDKRAFEVLGIQNDSRGGDSCGIFIDGQVEYGIGDKAYFEEFYDTSKLLQSTTRARIAIGHCRKASVGDKTIKEAQPNVIMEDGQIKFVTIHNGTIHNYLDLADKYLPDEDCSQMTDSQVMTRIFYKAGYNVLSEYVGSAAFCIVDYREEEPKVFLYKGKSKSTQYGNALPVEERPLWIGDLKNGLMFSSLSNYIPVFASNHDVFDFDHNTLMEVKGSQIYKYLVVDRSSMCQAGYGYSKGRKTSYSSSAYSSTPANQQQQTNNPPVYSYFKEYDDPYTEWDYSDGTIDIDYNSVCDIYEWQGKPAHGQMFLDKFGIVSNSSSNGSKEFWFYQGVLLYGKAQFMYIESRRKQMIETYGTDVSAEDFISLFESDIHCLGPYPYKQYHLSDGIFLQSTVHQEGPYTGTLYHAFTNTSLTINSGIKTNNSICGYNDSWNDILTKMSNKPVFNYIELNDKMFKFE